MKKARGREDIRYYDRVGRPIDLEEWYPEFGDRQLVTDILLERRGRKTKQVVIRTAYWGFDPYRHRMLPGGTPMIYETTVTDGYPDHLPRWYATEKEARDGHILVANMQKRLMSHPLLRIWEVLRFIAVTLKEGARTPYSTRWAWGNAAIWAFVTFSGTWGLATSLRWDSWGFAVINGLIVCFDIAMLTNSVEGLLFLLKKRRMESPRRAGGPQGE